MSEKMSRLIFGLLFQAVFAVGGYYYKEYFPEERSFRSKKGDDYDTYAVQEQVRPDKWTRLKQRSEDMLRAYNKRGYYYNDYTPYRRERTRQNNRNIPQSNVYVGNNRQSGWYGDYTRESSTHVKGPRTVSRENEYGGTSEQYVYPQETVEVSSRYVDVRPDYTDKRDRKRNKKAWKKTWKKKWGKKNSETTEYGQSARSSGSYQGCVDTGEYCTFWKSIGCCEEDLGRKYCAKTCGFCSPQQTVCPSSYKFGCCWNGDEANDLNKSNCPDCRDLSKRICSRPSIYRDCDLNRKNGLFTRRLCPVVCGACTDYSSSSNVVIK